MSTSTLSPATARPPSPEPSSTSRHLAAESVARTGASADDATATPAHATVITAAAGVLHLLVAQAHSDEPWLLLGFVAVGALQLLPLVATRTAAAVRDELLLTVNLVAVAAWVVSRTVGLPAAIAAGGPEAVGRADLVIVALQVVAIGLLLTAGRRAERSRPAVAPSAVMLLALGAVALAAPAAAVHEHGRTVDLDRLGLLGPNDLIGRSPVEANPDTAAIMKERMTGLDADGNAVGPAYVPIDHDH